MKAVIMAGGEGKRLRPLTCDLPKPMARLCGRPVLEYILDLLADHQFTQAAITMRYLPGKIREHFAEGVYRGITIDFSEEDVPLGTAGSVKYACKGQRDEVLVISGDAMCDFDLTAAIRFHRENKADATLIVKKVANPREYGLVKADEHGVITGFVEKPAYTQAVSELANCGVYILSPSALEMIPDGEEFDFSKDLFVQMLAERKKLMAYEEDGYWCDIGDLGTYVSCQRDMLLGKVRCDIHGERDEDGNVFAGNRPAGAVSIVPPIYIGRNVQISGPVFLQDGAVIDDDVTICDGTTVKSSILLQGVYLGRGVHVQGAVLCHHATAKAKGSIYEGAAIGFDTILGRESCVHPNVLVWPKKELPDQVSVNRSVKTGGMGSLYFDDEGIEGESGAEITPEFCVRLGAAVGSINPSARIGIASSNDKTLADALRRALCLGIQSTGADVFDFGCGSRCLMEFAMVYCALGLGIYLDVERERVCLRLMAEGGLPAPRWVERSVESALARDEFDRCPPERFGRRTDLSGLRNLYSTELMKLAPYGLANTGATVRSGNRTIEHLMNDTLQKLGCKADSGVVFTISEDGERVSLSASGLEISHDAILAALCCEEFSHGRDVALCNDAPRYLDQLAESYQRQILRYRSAPADKEDQQTRQAGALQMWSRDAMMMCVRFLAVMSERQLTPQQLLEKMPPLPVTTTASVPLSGSPAKVISALCFGVKSESQEGVLLEKEDGVALVRPTKKGTAIKVFAEAANAETAQELCGKIIEEIRRVQADNT